MQYRKINKIRNVIGFDIESGNYSFINEDKEYLSLNNELFQKEEAPLLLETRGKYFYLWYGSVGKLEVYSNEKLLTSIKENSYLIDKKNLYVGYSLDINDQNLINPITGELLLSKSIPYKLYVTNNIIFAYDNFRKKEIIRVNTYAESIWQFPLSSLGGCEYEPGKTDKIDKILGITHGNIWFYTDFGRLVALDLETGDVVKKISGNPSDKNSTYEMTLGLGDCFFRPLDKNIVSVSGFDFQIIDTEQLAVTEQYDFREADPMGIGTYRSIYSPMLQGDYFTFLGIKEEDFGYIRWIGIFDYKARKLVWEYEVISEEVFDETRNQLVPPQPLYMSGNKLYVKDIKDNLHIFEREDI